MMESDQTQQLQESVVDATQVTGSPDATQMVANVSCPVCKTDSPPGEQYCVDCGFLLSSTPVEVELAETVVPGKLVEKSTGREFSLRADENTVGRQNSDILLMDGTVSRAHAKVTLSGISALVEDLGSSNGTFVDGQQVQQGAPVEAHDGSEIKFGSAVLILELPETSTAEEVEPEGAPLDSEAAEAIPEEAQTAGEMVTDEIEILSPAVSGRLVGLHETAGLHTVAFGDNTVGRKAGNSIVIPDPYVSGSHAVISAGDDGCRVTDIGSSNGTLVNNEELAPNMPRELHPGDEVVFGRSKFRFEVIE